ncbi:MAG: glycine-rich domain-containing protein-like [Alphaproteobacteria bacterium]
MTYGTDMTFAQRLAKVDLNHVMKHVQADTGMDDATLARAEDLYRKFLTLKETNVNGTLVPPRIIDIVWHAHITFTRQYMADCEMLFGEYLHHTPTEDDTTDGLENITLPMFEKHFGISLHHYGIPAELLTAGGCH